MKKNPRILVLALLALGGAAYAYSSLQPATITLTGIVTTNDVIVSPQVAGQLGQLLVSEGDVVKKGQLLATITPDELKADTAYYAQNAAGLSSQVRESEAALRFEQSETDNQTAQAEVDARRDRGPGPGRRRRPRGRERDLRPHPGPRAPADRLRPGPGPGARRLGRRAGEARRAPEAGRGAAGGGGPGARQRRAGDGAPEPGAGHAAPGSRGRRPAREGRRAPRLHRDPRAHRRRSSTCAPCAPAST